jgi:hypothetical protein
MGMAPWGNFAPYEPDVKAALQKLQGAVFESGDFLGGELDPESLLEAFENAGEDGTMSPLDMVMISDTPGPGYVCRVPDEDLNRLFGTLRPTHEMVDDCNDLYENVGRGEGFYLVVYKDAKPSEYYFGGYSFD